MITVRLAILAGLVIPAAIAAVAASAAQTPADATTAWPEGPAAPFSAPRLDAWTVIGPGGGGAQFYPTISPLDPGKVLVRCDMTGAYITENGGESWRMFNLRSPAAFFTFDPVDPNVMYFSGLGLMRSADGGRTWSLVFPDPADVTSAVGPDGEQITVKDGSRESISALAVDPSDSKTLYVVKVSGGAAAFCVSTDWGKTWKKLSDLSDGGRAIYVDPKSPKGDRTLYVIAAASVSVREGGKWTRRSAPEGVTPFREVSGGFPAGGGALVIYGIASGGGRRGGPAAGNTGVYKSADGGATWQKIDAGLAAEGQAMPDLLTIAACFTRPDVAYLSYGRLAESTSEYFGVAKTADGGKTWRYVWKDSSGKPDPNVHDAWLTERFGPGWGDAPRCLGVAPTDPDICYGGDDGRTMRTTDGGKTWTGVYSRRAPTGDWSTTGLDVTTCYGVYFDPFDPKRIFIGYTDIGLFVSEDGGASWRSATTRGVPRGWINTTYWMIFDPKVKGRAWAAMADVHDLPRTKMLRTGDVQQAGGVCVTADSGATWQPSNQGMPETDCTHILLDPASPVDARVLYVAGLGTGVWKSSDGGRTWTLKSTGIAGRTPYVWRLARDSKGVLYCIVARSADSSAPGTPGGGKLYRSTDAAENWKEIALPDGCNGPNALTVDPADDKRLYLAAWGGADRGGAGGGGIYLSTDGGATWKSVLSKDQHVYDVTTDPADAGVFYACGFESSAWRSADRGETWKRIKGFNFRWGHRVIPDPHHAGKIFITTYGGSVWYGPSQGDPNAKEDLVTPQISYDR